MSRDFQNAAHAVFRAQLLLYAPPGLTFVKFYAMHTERIFIPCMYLKKTVCPYTPRKCAFTGQCGNCRSRLS